MNMDDLNQMADELAAISASTVTQYVGIADKYGLDRNAVVWKAATVFFETTLNGDYTNYFVKEETV